MTSSYLLRPLRTLKQAQLDAAVKKLDRLYDARDNSGGLLRCASCGAVYPPKASPTARRLPHCIPMVQHVLAPLEGVYMAGVMGFSDYNKGTVK